MSQPLTVGSTTPDCTLICELGREVQGNGYYAGKPTGESVAVMFMHTQYALIAGLRERFREARTMVQLNHPNFCKSISNS